MSEREEMVRRHIKALRHDGYMTEIRTITGGQVRQAFFTDPEQAVTHVSACSASSNVFIGINPRFAPYGDTRHTAQIGSIVFDFDPTKRTGRLKAADFNTIESMLSGHGIGCQPIYTGRGYHMYGFFKPVTIMGDRGEIEDFQNGLRIVGSEIRTSLPSHIKLDSTWDPARVMRTSGTVNMKNREATYGFLEREETDIFNQISARGKDKRERAGTILPEQRDSKISMQHVTRPQTRQLGPGTLGLIKKGYPSDESLADFKITCDMLRAGFTDAEIANVLWNRKGSKAQRHSNGDYYIKRTINAARKRIAASP